MRTDRPIFGRFARAAAGVIRWIPGYGLADERAPEAERGPRLSLIRTQRVVVERSIGTADLISSEIEQERQKFFHDTSPILYVVAAPTDTGAA
jgi:hypothetical protein